MSPILLLAVAFCLCIAAVIVYINRENNDFNRALTVFGETKAKVDSSEERFSKLTDIVEKLTEAVKRFEEFDAAKFLELEKRIAAIREELKIVDVRMHGVDKRVSAATRNVNITFSEPLPIQVIKRAKSTNAKPLLDRAGIKKRNEARP